MAEEEEGQEEEGGDGLPPEQKGSRVNQFIMLAAVVLLCQSALAYVLVTRFVIPKQKAALGIENGEATEVVKEATREAVPINVAPTFPLKEILVNPVDETALRYLNAVVILELENEEVLMELGDKLVATRVYDLVFRTLGTIPLEEMDESDERQRVKDILVKAINESGLLTTGEVTGILFERFILH